jgi:hypothetical protein
VFQLLVAAFLLPLGTWLAARTLLPPRTPTPIPAPPHSVPSSRAVTALALIVGVVGGIFGMGGGSILGPVLTGRGIPVNRVAPAALASTFLASSPARSPTPCWLSSTTAAASRRTGRSGCPAGRAA